MTWCYVFPPLPLLFVCFTQCNMWKTCQQFMQNEPASSQSKHSNMFQVQVSFWYCFTVKGTTHVNWDELNYFSYWTGFQIGAVNLVHSPCGEQNRHWSNQSVNTFLCCGCTKRSETTCCIYFWCGNLLTTRRCCFEVNVILPHLCKVASVL